MNRENKRKKFEKGYYKNHPCQESFTCKSCGRLVTPGGAGSDHRHHCPNSLSSRHEHIEGGMMGRVGGWGGRGASGPSSTAAAGAGPSPPTGWRRTTTP